jgi:two-component system cell cycle sensor histidine kinase/response regulator CckA
MTAKSLAQRLEVLEQRWQELQDRARACPEARAALAAAFGAVSQAIAALRAAGKSLPAALAGAPPAPSPAPYETILSNIFNAIPDLLTVIDRDYNIVMSNWHRPPVPKEFLVSPLKCYRAYHRRDRPCEDCHVQQVFATGQPLKVEKTDELGGRVLEFSAFPILDECGQVTMVAEHVRDIQERHLAEKALRESEERFRAIFDTAQDSIFIKNRSLRYIQANAAMGRLFDCPVADLIGKSDEDLFGEEAAAHIRESDRRVLNGEVVKEVHTKPVQGVLITFHVVKVPLHDDTGEVVGLCGIARDITDLKRAEEALRESEKRFRDIAESAAEWVWEVDAQGKYTYSSPVVEQLLGYKPEEILGQYFYDFFIPEEREQLKQAALAAFAAKQPFKDFLNPNLHKNGQIVWLSTSGITILDDQGDLRGYRGADIDITARREAEEFSRNLITKSPFGIYLLQDRKLRQVNQSFFTITGYREDELANLEPIELIHPEDREATRDNVIKMLKGLSSVPYEYRTITKGGEAKWIMETVTSVQYQGERAALGYFFDITGRKQLQNQLLQAQKMEAVGRLAGGVAHDFNNLLMAITGYGELMRAKVLKGDPLYDHLKNMLKASERAAGLTRQLLTFSRQQIAHPQIIDLNRVVLDMEPMLRRLIGEDIDLEIRAEPGPAAVKADPGYLGQIIMNLAVNARDAMPRGGRLTLKTAAVEIKGRRPARFGPVPPGAYVMLVVQDTGVGMDEVTQAHIFEPFFTTKEPGKGTGLGLSTVYGIVNQSGGYIAVDSEPGAGSTFTIYLPRLMALTEPPPAKIPLTAKFRGEETILLVEDEDVLRNLLTKFLRLYGYTVLDARHGGEALLLCERHPGPIHLMVTDVVMPQMSGRELAERLAPLRPDMKVVYMSGYADDSIVQYGVADLSVPFLQKPFKPIELARKVHAVLHPPAPA